MFKKALFPGRYIQGQGALGELSPVMRALGRRGLILASPTSRAKILPPLGLPTTLADLGLTNVDRAGLTLVAQKACAPGECIHNEAGVITPEYVLHALIAADALGRARKA